MTLKFEPALASDERAVVHLWKACGLTVPYNDPATSPPAEVVIDPWIV